MQGIGACAHQPQQVLFSFFRPGFGCVFRRDHADQQACRVHNTETVEAVPFHQAPHVLLVRVHLNCERHHHGVLHGGVNGLAKKNTVSQEAEGAALVIHHKDGELFVRIFALLANCLDRITDVLGRGNGDELRRHQTTGRVGVISRKLTQLPGNIRRDRRKYILRKAIIRLLQEVDGFVRGHLLHQIAQVSRAHAIDQLAA